MLNILKNMTDYLLQMEQREEESCAIPDESINDWYQQVIDELDALRKNPQQHQLRIEQLEDISAHLKQVLAIRANKCHDGGDDA